MQVRVLPSRVAQLTLTDNLQYAYSTRDAVFKDPTKAGNTIEPTIP